MLILLITLLNILYIVFDNHSANAIHWTHYNGVNVYHNKSFSVSFPNDWKLENYSLQKKSEGPLILGLIPPNNPLGYPSKFTIGIEKTDVNTNLTDYTKHAIKLLKNSLVGFKLLDLVPVIFSGMQGDRILYTHSLDNKQIQVMQVWLKDELETYILTFATKPDYYLYFIPLVNHILDSFKISQFKSEITNSTTVKLKNYVFADMFEIQYPYNWTIDQKNNRVSIISPVSGPDDLHLERLDVYFDDSMALNSSAHSNSTLNLNNELLSEINYIQKNLPSVYLISVANSNHSQGLIKVLTYTYESNIGPTFVREYLFDSGQKRAILVFSASIDEYSAVLPQVNQIVERFKFR